MKVLSIAIPVYYNAGSLPGLFEALTALEAELADRKMGLQLIFVDDGSRDESIFRLLDIKRARPETIVLKLSRNFGAISALKTGLRYATGDCFMWLAADLQDPPSLIPKMLDCWESGSKAVICVRSEREDPLLTRLFAWAYYKLVRQLVSPDFPEGGFDLALMDKQLLPYFREAGKNLNLSLLTYWLGFQPTMIPYKRENRRHGKSRWTFSKKLKLMIDSIIGFSFAPIRMISLAGGFFAIVSAAYAIFQVTAALAFGSPVRGFPTLAALVAFLFSVVMIMLGVLGEYLWRILDEINHRPEAIVDEIYADFVPEKIKTHVAGKLA